MIVNVLNKDINKFNINFIQYLVQLNALDFLLQTNVITGEDYKIIAPLILKENLGKK